MPNNHEKYYSFLSKLFKFETKITHYPVDFTKPWWSVFWNEKARLALVFVVEIVNNIFEAILPLLIGLAIESQNYKYLFWIMIAYFGMETIHRFVIYFWHIAIGNLQASIILAIQTYFLTVDPIKHAIKSSGQIISKIQSASGQAFMVMLLTIVFEILPVIVSYFTVALTLLYYNTQIGIVAVVFFVIITTISSFLRYFHSVSLNKPWIKARDKYVANQVENLQQNALIRSTFATPEQIINSKAIINQTIAIRNTRNQGNSINTYILRFLYFVSMLVISNLIFQTMNSGVISTILATTLLLTYFNGSRQILKIGDMVAQVTESNADLVDLYDFVNNFGKQTYPVLDNDLQIQQN